MPSIETIKGYHAHVYYDLNTKGVAEDVREGVAENFPKAALGRWYDAPIGPHPTGSYQIAFGTALYADLVPWLSLNRQGLVVLVHPLSGDDLADHTDYAQWMGGMPELDLSVL